MIDLRSSPPAFLAEGGQAARLIASHDWSKTSLGAPVDWPSALKSTLATLLLSPLPMCLAWGESLISFFNDACIPLLGERLLGAMGRPFPALWSEAWMSVEPIVIKALRGEGSSFRDVPLPLTRNGSDEQTWWSFTCMPVRDENGAVRGMLAIVSDSTAQVLAQVAEQTLSSLQRPRAEDALRQSQKLEAVGQLTRGVAHEFNNLLHVIGGSVALLRRRGLSEERRDWCMDTMTRKVERGAQLTSRLLAFARRQPLKSEVFDVGNHLEGMTDLLRPLVGASIEIDLQLCHPAAFAQGDIGQFETALVDLAVNARDAMMGKGRLTIKLEQVEAIPALRGLGGCAGKFIAISMSNTGDGIFAERLQLYLPRVDAAPVSDAEAESAPAKSHQSNSCVLDTA